MGQNLGDIIRSKSKEVDPVFKEVAVLKQLIKERVDPLDLLRELLSNAGAREVGATRIEISYTKDKEGHIFEIADNGCGMNYTGEMSLPGRLDRFLGLGLSSIVGIKSDEFSWKGLGSKLTYHSRRVDIETCLGDPHPSLDVRINEPWETIEHNRVPKARINEHPAAGRGTKIRVIGHPPHRRDEPFSFQKIKTFLQHRTFVGFTRKRDTIPEVVLSVLGQSETIGFGFPEFRDIDFDSIPDTGVKLEDGGHTLLVSLWPKKGKSLRVHVKGFLTWDPDKHKLSSNDLNTGLILSVKGIPYFNANMEEYGVTSIRTARPGEKRTCLVVECDAIQEEMNISRSGLVDSARTIELKKMVAEIFQRIESSSEYLTFRRIPEKEKHVFCLSRKWKILSFELA